MIVVKVGGSEGIDLDAVCQDVADLHQAGQPMVLVHGGSHETNVVAEKLGHPPVFVTSASGYVSRLHRPGDAGHLRDGLLRQDQQGHRGAPAEARASTPSGCPEWMAGCWRASARPR